MKDHKDYMTEKVDGLALEHHDKFYCDLPDKLQFAIWHMAERMWVDDYSDYMDHIYEQGRDRESNNQVKEIP